MGVVRARCVRGWLWLAGNIGRAIKVLACLVLAWKRPAAGGALFMALSVIGTLFVINGMSKD